MNYIKISTCDIANGEGVRVVLWVAGCSHHCINCHNPETWDSTAGTLFDKSAEDELFNALSKPYIQGITFSGGDPMFESNRKSVVDLMHQIRKRLPNKDIWMYTGYTWETLQKCPIGKTATELSDVVVDGKFIQDLYAINLAWKGSSNQRVINSTATYKCGKIILYS